MTDTELKAKIHFSRLVSEVRRGIFSEDKMDLLLTNPAEFLAEYLNPAVPDGVRGEVAGIIQRVIITGFFRSQRKAGMAEMAEKN
jgi:hypothetical protein